MTDAHTISPILRTKLHRPPVPADLVPRSQLLVWLEKGRQRPFTLVSAAAGYGKSVLISSWLEACEWPSAWVSLDDRDNDVHLFLAYVLAAVQMRFPAIGQPTQAHIDYAHQLIQQIPKQVVDAAHEPFAARVVVYCLVIDRDTQIRDAQLQQLEQFGEAGIHDLATRLLPLIEKLPLEIRLPLIDMTIPAMKNLSPGQYGLFKSNLEALVRADEKIDRPVGIGETQSRVSPDPFCLCRKV